VGWVLVLAVSLGCVAPLWPRLRRSRVRCILLCCRDVTLTVGHAELTVCSASLTVWQVSAASTNMMLASLSAPKAGGAECSHSCAGAGASVGGQQVVMITFSLVFQSWTGRCVRQQQHCS